MVSRAARRNFKISGRLRQTFPLPVCLPFPAGSQGPHACGPWPFASQYRFLVATAFGLCVGAAYMPPAETVRRCPLPVCMVFALPCRAGDFTRRTDKFFDFYNVRRGLRPQARFGAQPPKAALSAEIKTPPYRAAETGNFPVNPA